MRFSKTIWLYASLVAVILQSFTVPLVFMGFELNREYIAAELCVNRDVPQSGCNGQCYLMKKLKQAQKDSQGTDKPGAKRETFWQHCTDLARRPVLLPLRETLRAPLAFSGHTLRSPASVFHPPQKFTCIGKC